MTRIYFKPQGPSSRQGAVGKSRKPTSKSSHLQHHHHHKDVKEVEDPQKVDDGWRSKLEPNAIEQIADGLEKMVMSWTNPTHKVQPPEPDFKFLHNHDDSPDFLSSDALKSSVMEFDDNSEQFSFGTKETTISFVQHHEHLHHNHNQPAHPNASPGQQQTLIVDTIGDPEGLMQELMKGNLLNNGFLSIQNGDSSITEYPQVNGPLGGTSAVWYLAPTLAIPNTLSYGNNYTTVHQSRQVFTGAEIEDDVSHIAHDEHLQQNGDAHTGYSSCGLEESEVVLNGIHQAKSQLENTVSEKLSCRLEALGSESWSETVEINGGTKIKDLLGRKLVGKGNGFTSSMDTGIHDAEYYKKKVEELQIALLECAMEYEVKIVEMKMKALQSKSQEQKVETDKDKTKEESDNGHPQSLKAKRDAQRVDYLKKQLSRVQKEKAAAARELSNLRKRETQFDLQRRSLDDALSRVNYLQSELAKKEQDIVDCRLREKEAKAQLYELQLGLQKAQAAQIEPRKLLTLLPALKDWIRSNKKLSAGPDIPASFSSSWLQTIVGVLILHILQWICKIDTSQALQDIPASFSSMLSAMMEILRDGIGHYSHEKREVKVSIRSEKVASKVFAFHYWEAKFSI